jgi:hypothetical protein
VDVFVLCPSEDAACSAALTEGRNKFRPLISY